MRNKTILTVLLALAIQGCGSSAPKEQAPHPVLSFTDFRKLDNLRAPELVAGDQGRESCDSACAQLRQEFRYVVYVGKQIYCYWDQKKAETGTDFDALATSLEKRIQTGATPTDVYMTLRLWASAFHDGHVNVLMKPDTSDVLLYTAPVRIEILGPATSHERVYVVEVKSPGPAKVGDEVLAIDGLEIGKALDQAETITSGSTKRMRRFFASRRLIDGYGAEFGSGALKLKLRRTFADGSPAKDLNVELARTADLEPKPPGTPTAPTTGIELMKTMILPGGLGYLRIDAFSGTQSFTLLDQAMRLLANTKGLLIDLRKNGGGDQSGNSVIAWLISKEVTRYTTSERMADFILAMRPANFQLPWQPGALFADWHPLNVKPKVGGSYGGKPVVALTSPNCFSACDTFTAGLHANKLATIVGEGTGGGTGTPLVFDLPISGFQFRYSVVRGLTAQNDVIEGAGTLPDQMIEPVILDRVTGADSQLDRALAVLAGQVGSSPATDELAAGIVARTGTVWTQGFDLAPTLRDEWELRRIAASDEL